MIIVLFHVLYILGKFVYDSYRVNRQNAVKDAMKSTAEQLNVPEPDYSRHDPEGPDDYDTKPPLKFFPPAYVQRYVAVSNVLNDPKYQGKLRKIVDFGCAEFGFLVYLKNITGIEEILCVDVDRSLLEAKQEKAAPLISEYINCRTTPLVVEICEGSVTNNDKKLEKTDAVVCIELIEHLHPDTLADFPLNVFGYIKPKVAIITTPNADFNVLFPYFSGFRHPDHKFEWSREQFQDWAENIVLRYPDYYVTFDGICHGPEGTEHLGACTQMAIFHRCSENDVSIGGVEGLFKTVAVYEYPFHVDNRSDEQKILGQATYYIRLLSFEYEELQEEIPLDRLLKALKTFYITMEALRSILVDGGWAVVDRETGPVVLVPQPSIFSDYSGAEEDLINNAYSATDDDDDDWNAEPGPPLNHSNCTERDERFFEDWNNECWAEEPSIIIPQNASVIQDNTYLFDGENISSDHDRIAESVENLMTSLTCTETPYSLHNNAETPNTEPQLSSNIDFENQKEPDGFLDCNVASDLNASMRVSDSSFNIDLESTGDNIFANDTSNHLKVNNQNRFIAQKFNRTLDFDAYVSASRPSTSPEPFLLHTVQMDQLLNDDSISNQNTSCNLWSPDNTFEQSDISKNTSVSAKDSSTETIHARRENPSRNNSDTCDSLHDIYINTSYDEYKDSDKENIVGCCKSTTTSCFNTDGSHNLQKDYNTSEEDDQLDELPQLDGNASFTSVNSCISDNLPRFTSSPKVDAKTSTSKRRISSASSKQSSSSSSSVLSTTEMFEPLEFNNKASLATTSETSLESNSNVSLSTASTNSYGAMKKWYHDDENAMYQKGSVVLKGGNDTANKLTDTTFTDNGTSAVTHISHNESHTTLKDETQMKCPTVDVKNKESRYVESKMVSALQDSCICDDTKHFINKSEDSIVNICTIDNVESEDSCNISLSNQPDELLPHVEFACDKNKGKTECSSVLQGDTHNDTSTSSCTTGVVTNFSNTGITSILENFTSLDNTKSSYNHAKDVSNINDKTVLSNQHEKYTNSVQSTSLLKGEEETECSVQSCELKHKDVRVSSGLEIIEVNELTKPASPEALETPPNSWSPEVMDSGYPNSASAQDMTPEYDLSSIAQDHISDSESPSVAEVPRLGFLEPIEVENGDLANNNRDGEGNNMMAAEDNELDDLQPLIDVLENDRENENDIYALENDFPVWLLRILEMANPADLDVQLHRDQRERPQPEDLAGGDARYVDRDEGFDSSSSDDSDVENNGIVDDDESDVNENAVANNVSNDHENASNSDSENDRWAAGDT